MKRLFISIVFFLEFTNIYLYANFWEKTTFKDSLYVTSIAIDSTNEINAGTNQGLFYYSNIPKKWYKYETIHHYVNNIIVDRFKIDEVYFYIRICIKKGVYFVLGNDWSPHGKEMKFNPTSICFNHYNEYLVSAIGDSETGGVQIIDYLSDNGWSPLNKGLLLENDSLKALDIVNKNDTIIVGLSNGLYYSTNAGEQWLPYLDFVGLECDKFVLNSKNDLYFIVGGEGEMSGLYKNNVLIFNDVLPLSSVTVNRNDDVFVASSIRGRGVFRTSTVEQTGWKCMMDLTVQR
jgi:hypothetical protein